MFSIQGRSHRRERACALFVVLTDQGHDVGLIRRFGLLSSVDFGYVTSTEVRVDPWTLIQRVK